MRTISKLHLLVAVLFLIVALPACSREIGAGGPYGYLNPEFSPDGRLLAFNLCADGYCDSVIYDIAAQTYTAFVDQEGRRIYSLTFSPDGKRVAFVVSTKGKWPWQDSTQQVAVGTPDGKSFRIVTTGDGAKVTPTFWNNDSVLFWSEVLVSGAVGKYKNKQLHIVDASSKGSGMVMPNLMPRKSYPYPQKFKFYGPSAPRPMGDGDHIVLSDYLFSRSQLSDEKRKEEERKESGTPIDDRVRDEVLMLSRSKQTVTVLKTGLKNVSSPVVALGTGQLFFVGRLEQNEGQRGYAYEVYVQDGEGARRITRLKSYMSDMDVTADGKTLALVLPSPDWSHWERRGRRNGRLLLYDVQTQAYRELNPKDVSKVLVHIQN